jgi:uncharacterized membrane protein
MAHITGYVRIAAPAGQVFDVAADSRNEPSFNPAMAGVELLTHCRSGWGHGSAHAWAERARRCW